MRLIKKSVTHLLIGTLAIWPVMEAMAQERLPQKPEAGKIIILSEKVGEIIDLEEWNYYKLPLGSTNFQSAVILQLPDSSLVIHITEMKEGVQQLRIIQLDQEILEEFRKNIEEKPKFIGVEAKILEAKEQAKIFAREKWTKERWREESLNDRGGNYRTAGTMLGFTLGAVAGMLIGKGLQERNTRKVETDHPAQGTPGEWGYEAPWTEIEYLYSYKRKNAPHWGAAIGGIAGARVGYLLGKKSDKKYYILVPKNVRMQKTKTSGFGNFLFGFGVTGPLMGTITGYTLYTPKSGRSGESNIGGEEFAVGYLTGAVIGWIIIDEYKRRTKNIRLWEESLLEEKSETSFDIEFIPLDPTAFSIYPRKSPSGEIFYEYRIDILRVHF